MTAARVRIRVAVPPGGLGRRLTQMTAWLDENCGAAGWAMTPSGVRGVFNDAISLYLADPTIASAFVCRGESQDHRGAYFGFARTSRRHGSERGCTGRPK